MTHQADSILTGLVAAPLVLGGLAVFFVLLGVTLRAAWVRRLLPRRPSETTYRRGVAVIAPLTLAVILAVPHALAAIAVIASFGWDSYRDGLRVVDKFGLLSDGRYLGVF